MTAIECRNYDPTRDKEAVHRIWHEVGWLARGKEEILDNYLGCGRSLVAELDGAAECLVMTAPGDLRYLGENLPFCCVTSVTTSRVARQQGLAKRLTTAAVAAGAAEGALVCGLGVFDQGYYDQLGFGSGGYEHWLAFDPSDLNLRLRPRVPRRITLDDWEMAHAARLARFRGHGSCNLFPPETTREEMRGSDHGFGLGYCDGPQGELTHYFWCEAKDVENGPYQVYWMVFQTPEQFLELMALIKSWGDQVQLVKMSEPPGLQLQDLLYRPRKQRLVTERSRFECTMRALAWWQMRMVNLTGCLARTHLRGEPVRFHLQLTDPIERFLEGSAPWRGLTGDYVVVLGPSSGAEPGRDETLPTLKAAVGAFTRMWLGVRPATGLAVTDELSGPRELLEALDEVLRLPEPKPDWDF